MELPVVPGTLKARAAATHLLPGSFLGGAGAGIAIVKQVREQRCTILKVLLCTGLKATVLLIFWVKTDNFLLD